MAISDKVKVGMAEYVVPATILVEFAAIAALAWRLGGWVWSVAAMAMVAVLLLFALALGCYIGLSAPEVLAVAFLFTALLTIYAVTVRALCLEYRKSGLAD